MARHVRRGGRLALLLPASAVQAAYAQAVTTWLRSAFGTVALVTVKGRVFADVQEQTVVLLASERGNTCDEIYSGVASDAADAVAKWTDGLLAPARLESSEEHTCE